MGRTIPLKSMVQHIRCYIYTHPLLQTVLNVFTVGGQILIDGGFWAKMTKDFLVHQPRNKAPNQAPCKDQNKPSNIHIFTDLVHLIL